MKFNIDRAAFLKAVSHVQNVVEQRNRIPILSNVLINAGPDGLRLRATDLDIEITEAVPALVHATGSAAVPARTLHDILRKLPDGCEVLLETAKDSGGTAMIKAGTSKYSVPTLPAEDFPAMSMPAHGGHTFELAAADICGLIDKTSIAISTEETRFYLNGIHLEATKADKADVFRAVATNGHILARSDVALPDGAVGMPGVIFPRKAVRELRRLIDGLDDAVTVTVSDTKIEFKFGATVLLSKLIDGTFPDYRRAIPTGATIVLPVDITDMRKAIDRATVIGNKGSAVSLELAKGSLSISRISAESGTSEECLAVEYGGGPLTVGFNPEYLSSILGATSGKSAEFSFIDAGSPAIVTDTGDDKTLFVVMPMRC